MPACLQYQDVASVYMAVVDLTLDLLIHLLAFLSYLGVASYSLGVS